MREADSHRFVRLSVLEGEREGGLFLLFSLIFEASLNRLDIAKLLINKKASVDHPDNTGRTALFGAVRSSDKNWIPPKPISPLLHQLTSTQPRTFRIRALPEQSRHFNRRFTRIQDDI